MSGALVKPILRCIIGLHYRPQGRLLELLEPFGAFGAMKNHKPSAKFVATNRNNFVGFVWGRLFCGRSVWESVL